MVTANDPLSAFLPQPLEPALERIRGALRAEGFGVLTDIDVQATLREKLGADFYPYRLLGVCSPDVAYRALEIDPRLGVHLPCTVAVYDTGAGTEIHIQDPAAALPNDASEGLRGLIDGVRARLVRVAGALAD
jgi:uncharacterized protein (DUF302 family)